MGIRRQTGFTLIEVMIALAILAIISAIAIPLYEGYIGEARIGTVLQDIRQAELILDDLALDNDLAAVEPAGYTGGASLGVYRNNSGIEFAAAAPAGTQPWLDPWGNIYRYERPPVRTDAGGGLSNDSTLPQGYDLYSSGPDGVAENGDDIIRGCNGEFVGTAGAHSC